MEEYQDMPDIIKFSTPIVHLGYLKPEKIFDDSLIPSPKTSNQKIPENGYWIKEKDIYYYFKVPITNLSFLKELLGVKISEYFSIPTVKYHLADAIWEENGKRYHGYGLISQYARNKGSEYTTMEKESGMKKKDNLALLKYIDENYANQPFQEQFRLFLIREYLTQECDRLPSEILIENRAGNIYLGTISDYEMEWVPYPQKNYRIKNYINLDLEIPEVREQLKEDLFFQKAIQKLMDIPMNELLEEVATEHQIRLIDYDKKFFATQTEDIKQYIKQKEVFTTKIG